MPFMLLRRLLLAVATMAELGLAVPLQAQDAPPPETPPGPVLQPWQEVISGQI